MILIEFDLAGAEWVVVAYLSGDANMLEVVRSGKSPHVVTGALIAGCSEDLVLLEHKAVGSHTDPDSILALRSGIEFPSGTFLPRSMSIRQAGKKSNHGCNYYMRYKRFALENEMPESDAEPIVKFYSEKAYPGLQVYWQGIRDELQRTGRCMHNCFGRKIRLVGEWGVDLWMAAYSFKPQSTVFDICRRGMMAAYNDETLYFYDMYLGAQVHDSLMVNYPTPASQDDWINLAKFVRKMVYGHMVTECHYAGAVDGVERTFTLGVDAKLGRNWGAMHSVAVPQDLDRLVQNLRSALSQDEKPVEAETEWMATGLASPELPSG